EAHERAQREPDEAHARAPLREIDAQPPRVEPLAAPDVEAFHAVRVVADEDERRAAVLDGLAEAESQLEERIAFGHMQHRPCERMPAAAAEPLLVPAVHHEGGIEADARIVHEDAAVHLADVDPGLA